MPDAPLWKKCRFLLPQILSHETKAPLILLDKAGFVSFFFALTSMDRICRLVSRQSSSKRNSWTFFPRSPWSQDKKKKQGDESKKLRAIPRRPQARYLLFCSICWKAWRFGKTTTRLCCRSDESSREKKASRWRHQQGVF